jgi:hypothetical protein
LNQRLLRLGEVGENIYPEKKMIAAGARIR